MRIDTKISFNDLLGMYGTIVEREDFFGKVHKALLNSGVITKDYDEDLLRDIKIDSGLMLRKCTSRRDVAIKTHDIIVAYAGEIFKREKFKTLDTKYLRDVASIVMRNKSSLQMDYFVNKVGETFIDYMARFNSSKSITFPAEFYSSMART